MPMFMVYFDLCVLGKQFAMIWESMFTDTNDSLHLDISYMSAGAHLLCLNTRQDTVPQNIFRVFSPDK